MNLKEQAAQYINDNGTDKVAAALQVKESTVKSWLQSKRFPVELIELMMSAKEQEADAQDSATTPDAPEWPDVIGSGGTAEAPDASSVMLAVLKELANKVDSIAERQSAMESVTRQPAPPLAQGPRVVASTVPDAPQFEVKSVVPGVGNSMPEPTLPDSRGMHMSTLLAPKMKSADQTMVLIQMLAKALSDKK